MNNQSVIDPPPNHAVEDLYKALEMATDETLGDDGPRVIRVFVRHSQSGRMAHTGWLLASQRRDLVVEKRAQAGAPVRVLEGELARKLRQAEAQVRASVEWQQMRPDYEIRAIRIPRLYLEALWLHSPAGLGDYVYPYALFDGQLKEGQRRTLEFFFKVAKQLAVNAPTQPE